MGKSTTARALASRCGASVLPADAIWYALKAATDPTSHPELHYFDPPDSEWRRFGAEYWCERHIRSARSISLAMDPVISYYLSERWPVIVEGVWITPADAARWAISMRACELCSSTSEKTFGRTFLQGVTNLPSIVAKRPGSSETGCANRRCLMASLSLTYIRTPLWPSEFLRPRSDHPQPPMGNQPPPLVRDWRYQGLHQNRGRIMHRNLRASMIQ